MPMPMKLNASAPQWVKDIWPDAIIVPDGELMGIKPSAAPVAAKAETPERDSEVFSGDDFNPHAKPGGGVYGRD